MSMIYRVGLIFAVIIEIGAQVSMASEKFTHVSADALIRSQPVIQSRNVKVWTIKQNDTIRINLVEMSGELALHQHPDAEHSVMVLDGRVRVRIKDQEVELSKGDFVSIPAGVPHKYWSLTKTSRLVSMDAPYYDPKKTVTLE
jgi:quercetin dioxygenase-like cupin family protein